MPLAYELKKKLDQYQEAVRNLRDLLNEQELTKISDALKRLEKLQLNIAVFGETNSGKSALLNSLFDRDNNNPEEWIFKVDEKINCWSQAAEKENGKRWKIHEDIEVVVYDTPGIAGDITEHLSIAKKIADTSDILIYVVFEPVKNELQVPILKSLINTNKPIIFAINKTDIRRPQEIKAIKDDLITKFNIKPEQIVESAGHPINGQPVIGDLVKSILNLIDLHHANLIDNTITEKLNIGIAEATKILINKAETEKMELERKHHLEQQKYDQQKKERMVLNHVIIHGYATAAATSAALLAQVPGGDEAALTTITTLMIGSLCANYKKLSKSLILTYMGVISGGLLGKMGASYLYRWVPFLGNAINAAVTTFLHETQGWLIVALLENGIYSKAQLEQQNIEELKSQAESIKNAAEKLRNSSEFASKINELKNKAKELEEEVNRSA